MICDDDIVIDILMRLSRAIGHDRLPDTIVSQVEREVRRDWGGERPYVAKKAHVRDRERIVRQARERGVEQAARENGISRRTVYRLLRRRHRDDR